MKMKYEKPQVAVEYYELSQSIAACITKIGLLNSECVLRDPDAPRRMKEMALNYWFTAACDLYATGTDQADGVCFHTSANAAFSS